MHIYKKKDVHSEDMYVHYTISTYTSVPKIRGSFQHKVVSMHFFVFLLSLLPG